MFRIGSVEIVQCWLGVCSCLSNGDGIRFVLSFSNDLWHPGEFNGAAGLEHWLSLSRTWVQTMGHPRYLRVGGRPVFKIFGLGGLCIRLYKL